MFRSQLARGMWPYRKFGGRIVLIREELLDYMRRLPGVTVEQALANVAARDNGEERLHRVIDREARST